MSNLNVNTITPLAGNTGTVSVSGSLYVKNDVSLGGNITFGDANTDTIKYVADVSSSIIPDQSASYDLGSSTQMWNKAYIQELSGSSGKRSITSSVDIVPGLDNTYNLGSSVLEWNDLHVDGTANLDNTDIDGTFTMDGSTFDVNATGLVTISGSGITLDSIGVAANFTVASDGAAEDLTIGLTGATDSSIVISSTGTGADAINIDTTAGSIDIDSADNITVDAADEISLTTTSADGHISLVSAHTAGDAVHIDANADAGSILNIDAGILDLDTDGKLEIDSVGAASHILHTATAGGDFTVGMDGSADASLILSSTGTGADALQITTTAGGIDITTTGAAAGEDIDISTNASINLTSTEDVANAIYLRANAGTSETIKIHSDQGTGAGSIELTSDAGGVDVNALGISLESTGVAANFTVASDGAAEDLTIAVTGATDSSIVINSTGTGADAIDIDTTAGSIDIDSADNITVGAADDITLTTTSADGEIQIVTAHTAGRAVFIDANANAGSIVDIDAGILDIDSDGATTINAASTISVIGATSATFGDDTEALVYDGSGNLDLDAVALDVDTSGAVNITTAGAASDITLVTAHTAGVAFHLDANANAGSIVDIDAGILKMESDGATTINAASTIVISGSTGATFGDDTEALAYDGSGNLDLDAVALDIDTSGAITIDAAGVASHIAITTAHTAGDAVHIDANANVGSIVNIDAGILDIDSDGATTIDAASTVTITGATGATFGDDTEALAYDGSGNLDLDAVALDVDTSGAVNVTTAGAASDITLVTAHTAGVAFHLDADADAGSIVDIDAGILDIDVTAAATIDAVGIALGAGSGELDLTTTGTMDINSAALDIDTSGAITIDAAGVASHIALVTAHTAGQAFHIDADANAGSIVDIDAGILDIDVTGAATLDAASLALTGAVTVATGIQSTAIARTATDDGTGDGTIAAGTSVVLVDADSDADHIIILPAPVVGNIITIIENGTTGYELRSSTPGSIGINGGTGSGAESAIAGAITYIRCVCVSSTSWIATQFDADGDESKVEAAA